MAAETYDPEKPMALERLARLVALALVLVAVPGAGAQGPGEDAFWYGTAAGGAVLRRDGP
jgi:hypothetical protein